MDLFKKDLEMEFSFVDKLSSGKRDESFGEQMNILADRRHEYESLQLELEDQQRPSLWRKMMAFVQQNGHLDRLFLSMLGLLARVDIHRSHPLKGSIVRQEIERNCKHKHFDINRFKWFHRALSFVYYLSSAHLAINSYYQYIYDFHYIRQQSFRAIIKPNTIEYSSVLSHIQTYSATPFLRTIRYLQQQSHSERANESSSSQLRDMERVLDERVEVVRQRMSYIGAPYITLHYVIQIIYWFLITSVLFLLEVVYYYHKNVRPFQHSLLRSILDWECERKQLNELIREEVDKFINSDANFTKNCLEHSKSCMEQLRLSSIYATSGELSIERAKSLRKRHERLIHLTKNGVKRQLMRHVNCCKQLKQMALDGSLIPYNRTLRWLRTLNDYIVIANIIFLGYGYGAALIFAFVFFMLSEYKIQLSLIDVTVICQAGVLVVILISVGGFYLSLVYANCADQIRYVGHMRRQFYECIRRNEQHFNQHQNANDNYGPNNQPRRLKATNVAGQFTLDDSWPPKLGSIAPRQVVASRDWADQCQTFIEDANFTQMNRNLLELFMHYKIFIAQLQNDLRSCSPFVFGCIVIMISAPISLRLHVTYLDDTFKLYAMLFCLIFVLVSDSVLLPLCYLYSRYIDLHKSLSSLLAHTISISNASIEQQLGNEHESLPAPTNGQDAVEWGLAHDPPALEAKVGAPIKGTPSSPIPSARQLDAQFIYDPHTIWLLRKELDFTEKTVSRFAISILSVRLTYASLLRLHFWVSLFSLSMVIQTTVVSKEGAGGDFDMLRAEGGRRNQEFFSSFISDPFGVFE